MSDPRFVAAFTRWYEDYLEEYMRPKGEIEQEPQPNNEPGDVSGLKLIVDADELFSQISPQLDSSDFFLLMVNGQQGSGKSTVARELAHKAHTAGYKIVYSSGVDIVESPDKVTREAKGFRKICLVLDDASYAITTVSSRSQNKLKSFFGLIRHALEGAQVLVIVNIHVTTGVPPIFKNSGVWIFSKPTALEYDACLKIGGRNKKSRDALEKMFQSIVSIQAASTKSKDIPLTLYGRNYNFRWGSKDDPGDGRLMLLLLNGEPLVYNSTNTFCEECKHVAFSVKVRAEDYITKRPSEESHDPKGAGRNA